jgi:hypothetical protein
MSIVHKSCVFLLAATFTTSALPASESARTLVQEFMNAVVKERFEERFGLNASGQFSLLSRQIRQLATLLECNGSAMQKAHPDLKPPPFSSADADLAFDRWDIPTSCVTRGNAVIRSGVVVEVDCSWDGTTDHTAGQKLQLFVTTVEENGRLVVSNVYHGKQDDGGATSTSMVDRLTIGANYKPVPRACRGVNRKYG